MPKANTPPSARGEPVALAVRCRRDPDGGGVEDGWRPAFRAGRRAPGSSVKSSAGDPDESTRSSVQLGAPWYAVALKPVPMRHGWQRSAIKMLLRCPQHPEVFAGCSRCCRTRGRRRTSRSRWPRAGCRPHRPSCRPTTSRGSPPGAEGSASWAAADCAVWSSAVAIPDSAGRPRTVRSRLVAVKSCCWGESWAQSVGSTMPGRPSWFRALAMAASDGVLAPGASCRRTCPSSWRGSWATARCWRPGRCRGRSPSPIRRRHASRGPGPADTECTGAPTAVATPAVATHGAGTKVATTAIVVATTRTSPMRVRQTRGRRGAASTTRSVSGGAVLTLEVSERPGGLLTHSAGFPGSCLVPGAFVVAPARGVWPRMGTWPVARRELRGSSSPRATPGAAGGPRYPEPRRAHTGSHRCRSS